MKLAADQLRIRFGAITAVNGVTASIASREMVVVAGPNGSGKTTLLRALLGLIRPASGRVTLGGRDLSSWRRRELAATIGALPQREEPAFPLTVRETMLMGRWAQLGPIAATGAEDERIIADALARCDVRGFESRTIDTLSGGEWQRVRLARALVAAPQLLLLDEPTAALDIGHEMALFDLLRQLVQDGLGVLAITHDLNLAARYADRIILMQRGTIAAEGVPAAVVTADIVSRVFAWPVTVMTTPDGITQVVPLPGRGPGLNPQP